VQPVWACAIVEEKIRLKQVIAVIITAKQLFTNKLSRIVLSPFVSL